jgi:hypothetical protein
MSATPRVHPLHPHVSDADHDGFERRVLDAPLAGGPRLGVQLADLDQVETDRRSPCGSGPQRTDLPGLFRQPLQRMRAACAEE